MTMKHIVAIAFITPFLTVSSMAQDASRLDQHVYQGGPKSNIPHATRQISSGSDIYAQGGIYAQGVRSANKSHAYHGGPQTVVPHGK